MKTNKLFFLFSILLGMLSTNASAYDFEVKNADGVMIYYNYINDEKAEVTYKMGDETSYSGSIAIPKEVTYNKKTLKVAWIGDYAFAGCSSLQSVTIPNSVTRICDGAFSSCENLESVTIPNSVTYIADAAFSGCSSLQSLTIPNSVTTIGNRAFSGCGLTSVTIPNSVTSINNYAFWDCSSLQSVTIPNSVTSIGSSAFKGCSSLQSVTIPNSVTSIGKGAFVECYNLKKVTSKIKKPFALKYYTFTDETYYEGTLYVPKGTVANYKATDGWTDFWNIVEEDSTTAINDVEVDNTLNTANAIYDTNGKRLPATSLDELPSGLYIINGKKVVK